MGKGEIVLGKGATAESYSGTAIGYSADHVPRTPVTLDEVRAAEKGLAVYTMPDGSVHYGDLNFDTLGKAVEAPTQAFEPKIVCADGTVILPAIVHPMDENNYRDPEPTNWLGLAAAVFVVFGATILLINW